MNTGNDTPAAPRPGPGLARRYALLITALVLLVLLLTGAPALLDAYNANLQHLRALQAEQAKAAAARIEPTLAAIERELGWPALAGLGGTGETVKQRRTEYIKLLRQVPAITEAYWIDPQGRERLRLSRLHMDEVGDGPDRSAEPMFKEASAGRVWRSAVSFRKQTEPYITIARPGSAGGGGAGGVLAVEVNLKFVWDVVNQIRPDREGIAFVVDGTGALIAHPDISQVLRQVNLAQLPQVAAALRQSAPDVAAPSAGGDRILGGLGGDNAHDAAGEPVLSAWATLQPLGWHVFVESPRARALAPVWQSLQRLALVLVLGLVVAALASAYLARRLVLPIRALRDGAERIAAGDLEHRIAASGGDELQALAQDFNRMARTLKASYQELEQRVEQRTAELRQALEHQAASSEVLQAIAGSVSDAKPVYDAILGACDRLFDAYHMGINLVDADGMVHLAAQRGAPETCEPFARIFPYRIGPDSTTGIAVLERRAMHYADVANEADVPPRMRRACELAGTRSALLVPLVWEARGIGVIFIGRRETGRFTDKEVALLETFAGQAVIAIQNERLVHQLEVASRHKSEFLASMSHELRTPLNAVLGFSEALIEQMFGPVNAKQLEYLRDIHSSGQHLLTLINDILDLSKIEAGHMELEPSVFGVDELLGHALALVRERAQRQGLRLQVNVEPVLGEWTADARKVKQVLLNLLSNAVKFTPAGGTVTVDAACVDEGRTLQVAVRDTGIGIAEADHELVFEAFRQARGPGRGLAKATEGTGLGLALARRFVELHGGTLRLHSRPGEGSTFTFTLPQGRAE